MRLRKGITDRPAHQIKKEEKDQTGREGDEQGTGNGVGEGGQTNLMDVIPEVGRHAPKNQGREFKGLRRKPPQRQNSSRMGKRPRHSEKRSKLPLRVYSVTRKKKSGPIRSGLSGAEAPGKRHGPRSEKLYLR